MMISSSFIESTWVERLIYSHVQLCETMFALGYRLQGSNVDSIFAVGKRLGSKGGKI